MPIEIRAVVYCGDCGNPQFTLETKGVKLYSQILKRMRKKGGTVTKAGKVTCADCKSLERRNPAWSKQ